MCISPTKSMYNIYLFVRNLSNKHLKRVLWQQNNPLKLFVHVVNSQKLFCGKKLVLYVDIKAFFYTIVISTSFERWILCWWFSTNRKCVFIILGTFIFSYDWPIFHFIFSLFSHLSVNMKIYVFVIHTNVSSISILGYANFGEWTASTWKIFNKTLLSYKKFKNCRLSI